MDDVTVIIVFDIGSSSVRAAALECHESGPVIVDGTEVQKECSFSELGHGDVPEILEHIGACMDGCLQRARHYANGREKILRVSALGFSSFAMSWLGVDNAGDPVTPLYTYGSNLLTQSLHHPSSHCVLTPVP